MIVRAVLYIYLYSAPICIVFNSWQCACIFRGVINGKITPLGGMCPDQYLIFIMVHLNVDQLIISTPPIVHWTVGGCSRERWWRRNGSGWQAATLGPH